MPKQKDTSPAAQLPDWAAVETAYHQGGQTVIELCADFNITRQQLYAAAKAGNWPKRRQRKQLKRTTSTDQSRNHRHTLKEALEFITMELMQRLKARTIETSEDHDKDARTLSSLVRSYEKLQQLDDTARQTTLKEANNKRADIKDADEERRQIAARLEKLIKGL